MSAEARARYARYKKRRESARAGAVGKANGGGAFPDRDLLTEAVGADSKEKRDYLVAERVALELKERLGQLVSRDYARQKFAEVITTIEAALDKMPTRVAHDLAAETDPSKIRARLEREVRECLTRASLDLAPSEDATVLIDEAPSDGKRVGRRKNARRLGSKVKASDLGGAGRAS